MQTFPVFWVLDYQPDLLSGLGLGSPTAQNPVLLVQRQAVQALWPPPEPLWGAGATPYVQGPREVIYAGFAADYAGEVALYPPPTVVAENQLALGSSLGMRQDARYTVAAGAPTFEPQRWGQHGTLALPEEYNTEELASSVRAYVFPPDGGWCMRAVVVQPAPFKRIAVRAPLRGPLQYDLADNTTSMALPTTSGDLTYEVEVDGVVQARTVSCTVPMGDEFGGRLYQITPEFGWEAPGWTGYIFAQVDSSAQAFAPFFSGSLAVDLAPDLAPAQATEGGHVVRWRQRDHEGRSTPWLRYLVPPLAAVADLWPTETTPATVGGFWAEQEIVFVSQSLDPDGQLVRWVWNYGDGTTLDLEAPVEVPLDTEVRHTYRAAGVYTLALTVYDADGLSHQCWYSLQVGPGPAQIGALVRPDGSLRLAVPRSAPQRVEIVAQDGAAPARRVLAQLPALAWPSLWQLPQGDLALLARAGPPGVDGSGPALRYSSQDGGQTWQ